VIASGLLGSESVVTTGFGRLADGSKVEVASAQEATQGAATRGAAPQGAADSPRQPRRRAGDAAKGDGQRVQNATGSPSPP
jgi:hypothetical protein